MHILREYYVNFDVLIFEWSIFDIRSNRNLQSLKEKTIFQVQFLIENREIDKKKIGILGIVFNVSNFTRIHTNFKMHFSQN